MNKVDPFTSPFLWQAVEPAPSCTELDREVCGEKVLKFEVDPSYVKKVERLEGEIFQILSKMPAFKGLKKEDIYKLVFMERDRLREGKFAYEKEEPGYLAGVLSGYLLMLNTLDRELTPQLFERLHDANVKGLRTVDEPDGVPLGFRTIQDGAEAFGLKPEGRLPTVTKKGLAEFRQRWKTYQYLDPETQEVYHFLRRAIEDPLHTIANAVPPKNRQRQSSDSIKNTFNDCPMIKLKPTRPETCNVDIAAIINIYRHAPKRAVSEKLRAIGRLCQDFDQRHVFVDGNIRTSGFNVLHRELLRNGLIPSVMRDVNQFDCLHLTQELEEEGPGIVEQIVEGQVFFKSLVGSEKDSLLIDTFQAD